MADIASLLTVGTAFFVVAASPGPATLATATVSMSAGRHNGLIFGAGLSVGLAFWGLIAATGMGALLQASSITLITLKILGGAYLIWLACLSARSACQKKAEMSSVRLSGSWFKRGLLLNLSNPKAVLAWMATLSLGVGDSHGIGQVIWATSLCVVLGFLIYSGYVLLFSTYGAMNFYARLRRWIDGVVAGLFALAGLSLLRSAILKANH